MTTEYPVRFPPPLARSEVDAQGRRIPVMQKPFVECGEQVRLRGVLVVCIRRSGHPVRINYGHSNGYDEWCFSTPTAQRGVHSDPERI